MYQESDYSFNYYTYIPITYIILVRFFTKILSNSSFIIVSVPFQKAKQKSLPLSDVAIKVYPFPLNVNFLIYPSTPLLIMLCL